METFQTNNFFSSAKSAAGIVSTAVYVDLPFLNKQVDDLYKKYNAYHSLELVLPMTLESMLGFIQEYLKIYEKYDVHLFGSQESFICGIGLSCSDSAPYAVKEHFCDADIARAIARHMRKEGKNYKELILIADDNSYPKVLNLNRRVDTLLFCNDESTNMYTINYEKWQNIDYIIAWSMGLDLGDI